MNNINARGVAQPCGDINFGANADDIETTTRTINTEDESSIEIYKVNKTSVIANENGISFQGFNTIGSTIMACCLNDSDGQARSGSTSGKHYGLIVSGSDLCWAAWDLSDGGQAHPYADGKLGLTGTWVKCSGMTTRDNGRNGVGIYRRIS